MNHSGTITVQNKNGLRPKIRHGDLPLQIARRAETELPAHASIEMVAATHEPHPGQVAIPSPLLRLLLQPPSLVANYPKVVQQLRALGYFD